MEQRTPITAERGPKPIGPYSHAIRAQGLIFCSGMVGIDPATGALVEGGVEAQARRALENLEAVLEAAGVSLAAVVKTTIFLVDMADFAAVNAIYATFLGAAPPARSTVAVAALPAGARVEIDAVAAAA
jgi:2-iminobutanoate/2-iminopropanoate deaminase